MKWRARAVTSTRAKERASISFFIFIMFFAVFGVIILTELLLLDRPTRTDHLTKARSIEYIQWEGRTETGNNEAEQLPPPAHSALDAVWQPVAGTKFKFFVYSAYVESRTEPSIRIIAATKTRERDKVVCRLWMPDNRTFTLRALVKPIRENWNLKYSATYVLCLLHDTKVNPKETVGATIAVLAVNSTTQPPTNLMTVLSTEPRSGIEETVHVCVKPFHYSFSRTNWLFEWFEMNRLLGVSHFYMYNKSMSDSVGCLLDHYRSQGLITLLPWKLPFVSKVDIRTEGLFAAFNDCLYRSMPSAGWLLVIDVDELVLPRRERSLPVLFNAMRAAHSQHKSRSASALMFRNAFFYLLWSDDKEAPAPLLTARKTRRWATPHNFKTRSKYAVRPREILELGNHFVWEFARGAAAVGVPPERALLHHYRSACEFDDTTCVKVPSIIDRTAHRWSEELMQRLKSEENADVKRCQA